MKICLDAGHYGNINTSPANRRYCESQVMWKLQNYLKKELESYGVNVITTRKEQGKNLDLYKRGKYAKGCDLFISLHSNAVGSMINERIDYPLAVVMLNGKSHGIGKRLVKVVEDTMSTKQEGRIMTRAGSKGEYYGVLRGCDYVGGVGIILEHSFHTNSKITKWLLNDDNIKLLAVNEAKCIADFYGVEKCNNIRIEPYVVRIDIDNLNIRIGPGTDYERVGYINKGSFTIVDEKEGVGASKWGLLKSYEKNRDGWISLDFVNKI